MKTVKIFYQLLALCFTSLFCLLSNQSYSQCEEATITCTSGAYSGSINSGDSNLISYHCGFGDDLGFERFGGEDFIRVVVSSVPATLSLTSLSANLDIFLYDDCEFNGEFFQLLNCEDWSVNSGTQSESIVINQTGTYWVSVDANTGVFSNYRLSLDCGSEPDCYNHVTTIECGDTYNGSLINSDDNNFTSANTYRPICYNEAFDFEEIDDVIRIRVGNTATDITITMNATEDLDMFLYDDCSQSTGRVSGCVDQSHTPTGNETITVSGASGTYYLIVEAGRPNIQSNYVISLSCGGSPNCDDFIARLNCEEDTNFSNRINDSDQDNFNSDNTYVTACGNFSEDYDGPDDVIRIDATFDFSTSTTLTIELTGLNDDLDMFLFDDCSTTTGRVAECVSAAQGAQHDDDTDERITITDAQGGYYLIIEGVDGADSPYEVNIICGDDCGETISCGQTIESTTIGQTNDYTLANYSACHMSPNNFDGPDRVFRFERYFDSDLNYITLWRNNNLVDLDLFILDACGGTCIQKSVNAPNSQAAFNRNVEVIELRDIPAGTYYIVVDAPLFNDFGDFSLSLSCEGIYCPDAEEIVCDMPIRSSNVGLLNQSSAYDTICFASVPFAQGTFTGGEKLFKFIAPETGFYDVCLTAIPNEVDLELFIIDDCCPVVENPSNEYYILSDAACQENCTSGEISDNGVERESNIFITEGDSIVIIVDGWLGAEAPFDIEVKCGEDPNCNNWISEIECDESVSGQISSNDESNFNTSNTYSQCSNTITNPFEGPDDLYRIFVGTDTKDVTINLTGLTGDLDMFLFRTCLGNGNLSNCIGVGGNGGTISESISIDNASGTYYLVVEQGLPNVFSPYTIRVDCQQQPDCFDPIVVLDCGESFDGSISNNDDNNFNSDNSYVTACGNFPNQYEGPDDVIRIDATPDFNTSTTLIIEMTGLSEDLDMFLFDDCSQNTGRVMECVSGTQGTNEGTASETITLTDARASYYLIVEAGIQGALSDYTLTIRCSDECEKFPPTSEGAYNLTLGNPENNSVQSVTINYPYSEKETGNFSFQDSVAIDNLSAFDYACPEPGCYYVCVWYFDNGTLSSCCFKYCVEQPDYDCNYPQFELLSSDFENETETCRILCGSSETPSEFELFVADSSRVFIDDLEIFPDLSGDYVFEFPYGSYTVCCWNYDILCDAWQICCKDICVPYIPTTEQCIDPNFVVEKFVDPNDPLIYQLVIPNLGGNTCAIESITPEAIFALTDDCQYEVVFPGEGIYKVCYNYADNMGYCCEYICIDFDHLSCEESFDYGVFFPNELVLECTEPENFKKWQVTRCAYEDPCDGISTDFVGNFYTPSLSLEMEPGYQYNVVKERRECCADGNCGICINYDGFNCNRHQPHVISEPASDELTYQFIYNDDEDLELEFYTIFDENFVELLTETASSNDVTVDFSSIADFVPDRTYIICYAYREMSGCLRICYEKYRIYNPFLCNYITPFFLGTPDNQSTEYSFSLSDEAEGMEVQGWTIFNDAGVEVQTGFGQSDNISWSSPDGGIYWICVYLYDPVFDCYQVCYYKFSTWYPYGCGYVVCTFTGDQDENSYNFSLSDEAADQGLEVLEWRVLDAEGQATIQVSDTPINQVFDTGITRVICVLLYDPVLRCYSVCYYKIRLANPSFCEDSVYNPTYIESSNSIALNIESVNVEDFYITTDTGLFSEEEEIELVTVPEPDEKITICFYYFDGFCWQTCCKEVCPADPPECYESCCPEGTDLNWLDPIIIDLQSACAPNDPSDDIIDGKVTHGSYNGACYYAVWYPRSIFTPDPTTVELYDCMGNLIETIVEDVITQFDDFELVWDCDKDDLMPCPVDPPSCYTDCCPDNNDFGWLDDIKQTLQQDCSDTNTIPGVIYTGSHNGQCVYAVWEPKPVMLFANQLAYYNCQGVIVDILESNVADDIVEILRDFEFVWSCDNRMIPECPNCYESCCTADTDLTWLDTYRETLEGWCTNDSSVNPRIEQCRWNGQCVYVTYPNAELLDFCIDIWSCDGTVLGSTNCPQGDFDLTELTDCVVIWECDKGYLDQCPPEEEEPCSDFVGDCESFMGYVPSGTCEIVDLGGNPVLEVTTFGPNLENCEETINFMAPSTDESVLSFDIYVQDGAIMEGLTVDGEILELAFQPGGTEIILSYQGGSYNLFSSYPLNRWFKVVLNFESNLLTGTIAGVNMADQLLSINHLTNLTFYGGLSTAPKAYYIDNLCYGTCKDDNPPACYHDCCPGNNDFGWLDNIKDELAKDCSDINISPGTIYTGSYNGQCVYAVWEPGPVMLFSNQLTYYNCQGVIVDILSSNVASDISEALRDFEFVWGCDDQMIPECEVPCRDMHLISCSDFDNLNEDQEVSLQANDWMTGFSGFDCRIKRESNGNQYIEVGEDANFNSCSSIHMLPNDNGANEIKLSMDLYLPGIPIDNYNGIAIELGDGLGEYFQMNFQGGTFAIDPQRINFAIQGDLVDYSWPIGSWFNIEVVLNKTNDELTFLIGGRIVYTTLTALANFSTLELNGALSLDAGVDNICLSRCGAAVPPPCRDMTEIECEEVDNYNIGNGIASQSGSWAVGFTGSDCQVREEANGNKFIEVGVDQNFDACSSIYTFPSDGNADEVKVSMDLYLPGIPIDNYNGIALELGDGLGEYFQMNFQGGTFAIDPQRINFAIQGDLIDYSWPIGSWFNIEVVLNKGNSELTFLIDGRIVYTTSTSMANFSTLELNGNLSQNAGVDNICLWSCEDCPVPPTGGPYEYDCNVFDIVGITPLGDSETNITFRVGDIEVVRFEAINQNTNVVDFEKTDVNSNTSFGWASFVPGNTYICCLYYIDDDGCLRRCCIKITIPIECSFFSPYFVGDETNLDFEMSAELEGTGLRLESWWFDSENLGASNEVNISYTSPGEYYVCCLLYDPVTRCYILCCRKICIENPLECDNIIVDYDITAEEYILSADDVQQVISWNIDIPIGIANNGYIGSDNPQRFKPTDFGIAPGQEIVISVRYIDADGCIKLCCRRLCPPIDPTQVCDFINPVYLGSGLEFYFEADTDNISEVSWRLHIPGTDDVVEIGSGLQSDELDFEALEDIYPSLALDKVCISIWYRDDVTGCYKICCKCFCIESSPLLCDDIRASYLFDQATNYKYKFELDIAAATNVSWTLDNTNTDLGTDDSVEVDFAGFGFGAGDQVYVTVRYYDTDSECFRVCCKVICLEQPSPDCGLISVAGPENGIYNLEFTGTSTRLVWSIDGLSENQEGSSIMVDLADVNGPTVRVCVLYWDASGCCRLCCVELDLTPLAVIPTVTPTCAMEATGSIQLNIQGGTAPYSIAWSTGDQDVNPLMGLEAGMYSVTVTDANQAEQILMVDLAAHEAPETSIEVVNSQCDGMTGSALIQVLNSVNIQSYTWRPSGVTTMIGMLDSLGAGMYEVDLLDENECITTLEFTIEAEGEFPVDLGDDILTCDGSKRTLIYRTNGSETKLEWYRDGTLVSEGRSSLRANEGGEYIILVEDEDGCIGRDTINISYNMPLTCSSLGFVVDNINPNIFVFEQNIQNGETYEWDFGDGNTLLDASQFVEYEFTSNQETFDVCLTVTDACGSECVECISVSVGEELVVNVDVTNGGCSSNPDAGSVELFISGGLQPYEIEWSNGLMNVNPISDLEAGTYSVTVSDGLGNIFTESFEVEIFETVICRPLTFEVDPNDPLTIIFNNRIDNGVNYNWDFGDNSTENNSTQFVSHSYDNTLDNYTACLTVEDACGEFCVQCVTVFISTEDLLVEAIVNDGGCQEDPLGSIELLISGGTLPYDIEWSTSQTTAVIEDLDAGTYTVTVTDAAGNSLEQSYEVEVYEEISCNRPISVEVDPNNPLSFTFSQNLPGGSLYEWDFGDGTILQDDSNEVVHVYADQDAIYTTCLSIYDACGNITCVQCLTVGIGVFRLDASLTNPDCSELGSIELILSGAEPPVDILWSDGSDGISLVDLEAGEYSVTVTDAANNEISETFILENSSEILITQSDTIVVAEVGDIINLTIENAITIFWESDDFELSCSDCLETSFEVSQVGTLMATAEDSNGCTKTIFYNIEVQGEPLFGPNMITPNDDSYNDILEFKGLDNFPVNKLVVFNRWGEVLYETNGYLNDWKAEKNGKPLPDGVYYYVLQYGVENENEFILKRDLLVMRER